MTALRFALLLTLVTLLAASSALAQWAAGGTAVFPGFEPKICSDGVGGAFIGWGYDDVFIQRLDQNGFRISGWPANWVPVSLAPDMQWQVVMTPDGSGGALLAWADDRLSGYRDDIYASHVLADGSIAPGWPTDGLPIVVLPDYQTIQAVVPDGAGGAYIVWDNSQANSLSQDIFIQHVNGDGTLAAGWPANGRRVSSSTSAKLLPVAVGDNAGGILVAWTDLRFGPVPSVYACRYDPAGNPLPGWPADGLLLGTPRATRGAATDGQGGAFIGMGVFIESGPFIGWDASYYTSRVLANGTVAPGFPPNGAAVCTAPNGKDAFRMTADGSGGAYFLWSDNRALQSMYVHHILGTGVNAPGWPDNGLMPSNVFGLQWNGDLVPDDIGGLYTALNIESGAGDNVYVQHLTSNGQVAMGWTVPGSLVGDGTDPRMATDGQGGAIVTWRDDFSMIRAQRFVSAGIVATRLSLMSAQASSDLVTLLWQGAGAATIAAGVERRTAASDWSSVGNSVPEAADRLRYEDRAVIPGERYAYRLSWSENGAPQHTSETWLDVPLAASLALEGLRPNPAVDRLNVSFSLASAEPASLELLDVSGRRLANRDVGGLGAGRHLLHLDEGQRISPGIYLLRLTQSGRSLMSRAVVVR
jgi:hypothetical protein